MRIFSKDFVPKNEFDFLASISRFIRKLRGERGDKNFKSQKDVATGIGISQSRLSKIESNESAPSLWEFYQILRFFNLTDQKPINSLEELPIKELTKDQKRFYDDCVKNQQLDTPAARLLYMFLIMPPKKRKQLAVGARIICQINGDFLTTYLNEHET